MPLARKAKPFTLRSDRNRIDLADDAIARQWVKKLGHPRQAIEAAIAKVGDNCETVRKELRVQDDACARLPVKTPVGTPA